MLASHVVRSHFGVEDKFGKEQDDPSGEEDNLEELACEIGCKVGNLLTSYLGLGLPLGALYESVVV